MAGRISQIVGESLVGDGSAARASQVALETLSGDGATARLSQAILESIIGDGGTARISQIAIEVLMDNWEIFMPPVYPMLPGLAFPVTWKTTFFNAPTQVAADGGEFDIGIADTPIHEFELSYELLRDTFGFQEQKLLRGFFGLMRGNLGRCVFKNPDDNFVRSQSIGTTDGSSRVWTLNRTYGVGEYSFTEPVGYVDQTFPFAIYLDAVRQDASSYTIDTTVPGLQQIIFGSTPGTGKAITVDMDYFYYCKLADDNATFEKFMYKLWNIGKITLRSCRPDA